jgi:hypothetical protein
VATVTSLARAAVLAWASAVARAANSAISGERRADTQARPTAVGAMSVIRAYATSGRR